jgi:multiple antibiotic resistance protein
MSDFALDPDLFVKALVTVTVLMDPMGTIPVFLSLTRTFDAAARKRAAWQASLMAGGVIIVFAAFGELILRGLGIGLPALQAAGGLLLLIVALELLRPFDEGLTGAASAGSSNIALVPLGTPLLAGPGAIATTLVYMRQSDDLGGDVSVVLALLGSLVITFVVLRFSGLLGRVLKPNGVHVLSRVMGLLLAAIAVQLVATAVEVWVREGVT